MSAHPVKPLNILVAHTHYRERGGEDVAVEAEIEPSAHAWNAGPARKRYSVITGQCDRLQLPRFTVRDWDGETLRRQLQQWSNG